ncbi:hypothetical protein LTR37_003911 [Vermiconidia calcicola]|uniref:Uncharacterized protein n=1 Tax=Vermiconidia calcicola TaxID=1690605 RepID=A0ACC3NQ26_9PEZI|nr:hypothetical protein LTR37_003911 [Vermiconidia calcicola]
MNGHTSSPRVPSAGVWAPAVTFFDPETDNLDLASQTKYYKYLSQHLTGLVILGTNAETFMLTRDERATLLKTAREAVGPDYEIMAGVGGHSTKQVLEFIGDAVEAKADYVLVLPCAYFGAQTSKAVVMGFYDEVAEKSPLPVVVYNFPGVCNGVDIDSDMLSTLHKKHKNIVGVKLTCASVGKITRLAAEFDKSEFAVYGGQSDFLLAGMAVGSAGTISGFGNVAPKTVRRIYDLYTQGKVEEALKLHRVQAFAEIIGKTGIANTKYGASLTSAKSAGIEGAEEKLRPRRPYEALTEQQKKDIWAKIEETVKIEQSL